VGSKLQKRLGQLQEQLQGDDLGRLEFFRIFFWSLVGLIAFIYLVFEHPSDSIKQKALKEFPRAHSEFIQEKVWFDTLTETVGNRIDWLDNSWLAAASGEDYKDFSRSIYFALAPEKPAMGNNVVEEMFSEFSFSSWKRSFLHTIIDAILGMGFVLIAAWPLWLIAPVIAYFGIRLLTKPKDTDDILGICSRKQGPFYSGIYAPLKPNHSLSGTDYSAPSLANPAKATKQNALNHPLAKILKDFRSQNETTIELVQIIMSYSDLPSVVEEERSTDSSSLPPEELALDHSLSQTGIVTNPSIRIAESSLEGLYAICLAHRALRKFFAVQDNNYLEQVVKDEDYNTLWPEIQKLTQSLPPLASTLVRSLTLSRARAVAHLQPSMVAASYLATEAGKCLVFNRMGDDSYSQISKFPHLQARAILQSVVSYHREYKGDDRLVMRQAIICSRRHGDFGRAFLTMRMPLASRALRDWLEILYAEPSRRADTAHLVELDAQLEEVHLNWRNHFHAHLKKVARADVLVEQTKQPKKQLALWKGLVHKSVVLMPLSELSKIALQGIVDIRRDRIFELIKSTRALHTYLTISARLPGFKRQAVEAESSNMLSGDIIQQILNSENGKELVSRWLIIRRTLTRYNWLSTRVGDDNVPVDGLVQCVLVLRQEGDKAEVLGLDALVPLRQRRFKELLGNGWERMYYSDSPHPDDLEIFVTIEDFNEGLKDKSRQVQSGFLRPLDPAVSA